MDAKKITESVYCIHADIAEQDSRFEGLWLLPNGVTINSYVIKGEKNALIDIVKDWDGSVDSYKEQLKSIGLTFADFDYIILNHLEPDHTDLIRLVRKENPTAKILATKKGIKMVEEFFKIPENLQVVSTGDTLDLGNGKVITFYEIPNVHWPETMVTYLECEKVLCSCDAFGSYACIGEKIFADQHSEEKLKFYEEEALRYYSNIIGFFSSAVNKAIDKISPLDIEYICPSHGLIWKGKDWVERVITMYRKFASYNTSGPCEKRVCIVWGSMYGYTQAGIDAMAEVFKAEGVEYSMFRLPETDASFVLGEALRSKALLLAMPTYENKMFPPMAYILSMFERKKIINKKVLRVGNFGWSGGAKREYEALTEKLKWDHLEAYEWKGVLSDEDLEALKAKAKELADIVKQD